MIKKQVPVKLTADERTARSGDLAELEIALEELEKKAREAASGYRTEAKATRKKIRELARAISAGQEQRLMFVREILDPEAGTVEVRLAHDGQVVEVRPALPEEMQVGIPFVPTAKDFAAGNLVNLKDNGIRTIFQIVEVVEGVATLELAVDPAGDFAEGKREIPKSAPVDDLVAATIGPAGLPEVRDELAEVDQGEANPKRKRAPRRRAESTQATNIAGPQLPPPPSRKIAGRIGRAVAGRK